MKNRRTTEDKTIDYLERRYCYERRQSLYIANEETNQVWDETDIPDFIKAWNNNWSLTEIAEYLGATMRECQLLAADLIDQGKIQGNIHIFKPKRRAAKPMETITVGDTLIRSTFSDREYWVCLQDVLNALRSPAERLQDLTETWGPDQRAKFVIPTDGGPQKFQFVNVEGLERLAQEMEPWERTQVERLIIRMNAATEKATKRKKKSKSKSRKKSG